MDNVKYHVVDFGNTKAKVAHFSRDRLSEKQTFEKEDPKLLDHLKGLDGPGIYSAVRPLQLDILEQLKTMAFYKLDYALPLPIALDYKTPKTLGNDRIAAAVGAFYMFPNRDCFIIDAGTCITADLLQKNGEYQGGIISPGIHMRLKAMNHFTGNLPLLKETPELQYPGKSTQESMVVGAVNGAVGELTQTQGDLLIQYPDLVTVVTGGDGKYFDKHLKKEIFALPNIVLEGLYRILKFNVS